MEKKHKRYALFIGRWQPFHRGHKFIIDKALEQGENVAIAVRETELSEKNPYTVQQRMEMIKRVYENYGDRVKVFPVCDIKSVNIGRKVGYDVNRIDVPDHIEEISGTRTRKQTFPTTVTDEVREYLTTISPTFWFTGLPCSGKSTLGKNLKSYLADSNRHVIRLDGDVLRGGLNKDLGFSNKDREENLRRAAHLSKLLNGMGHTVIASFITPTEEMRKMIRGIIPNLTFIYAKCSLDTCKKRDVKGMYKKAERGEIKDFTGVSAPFEEPKEAELVVDTENNSIQECLKKIIKEARQIDIKES